MSQRSSKQVPAISGSNYNATASNSMKTCNINHNQVNTQYNSKNYDRIRVLGKGSFGIAIVHRRKTDCSLVVLKEIDLQKFKGEREKTAAINEARIMSTLDHVNIIKYHNAYTTDTKLVIEMDYASMGTLATYVLFQDQPLEEQEILGIFRQITCGLNYLHSKNIIHLDLKMANIFVTVEGLIKIGDFSISQYIQTNTTKSCHQQEQMTTKDDTTCRSIDTNHTRLPNSAFSNTKKLTSTNSHLGTLAYSSPERCLGEETNFKSDIWSLGCILYELITLKPLFSGNSLAELILNITQIHYIPIKRNIIPTLKEIFEQMISADPNQRPTANELLCITDQLLSHFQLKRQKINKRYNNRFELSTDVAFLAANNDDDLGQINYPHSLVYQVRLDSRHIHIDRVNLPQSKRIKEMSKGKSHYLVLTYDNIVYGWGSKNFGQLGACGLSSSNNINRPKSARFADSRDSFGRLTPSSAPSSVASSTQTIVGQNNSNQHQQQQQQQIILNNKTNQHLSKQLVMNMLEESQPTLRPFIINELNHRKIIQVAAGNDFSIFLGKTGIVMSCGDGSRGCLGHGNLKSCFTPLMVESLLNTDVVSIACGSKHVVAVCGNGRAFSWGKYSRGRLGILKGDDDARKLFEETYFDQSNKYVLIPQQVQFPNQITIKSAYCGDKSTVFIDSENRCWACGENRFNKLGLDIKRRFKKTIIVDKCFIPTEIDSLNKYKIITCNIGKNHSSFLTSEGKLIIFGQDIDHTYRFKSNVICGRDSHRRISYELQTKRRANIHAKHSQTGDIYSKNIINKKLSNTNNNRSSMQSSQISYATLANMNYKHLTKSSIAHNQLKGFKKNSDAFQNFDKSIDINKYPKFRLSKSQKLQIDSYLKKSRAIKKMPFECVISVNCTSKFTLALTNDNHVYFWGTRSYEKEEDGGEEEDSDRRKENRIRCRCCSTRGQQSMEPQLASSNSDECFIKIGATNSSLMSNIQILGSDQPIIHAQDPHLKANSLADLWILDYKPSSTASKSSPSSSSSSSSSTSFSSLSSHSSISNCSSISQCSCESCLSESAYYDDCMKHAAILEPQPIVSLYVPSMFNHNGCSLNLVDLFCFDEDRFYIILDTTIKLQQTSPRHQSSSNILVKNNNQFINKSKLGSLIEITGSSTKHQNPKEMSLNTKQQQSNCAAALTNCLYNLDDTLRDESKPNLNSIDSQNIPRNKSFSLEKSTSDEACDHDDNVNFEVNSQKCPIESCDDNNNTEGIGISSSQGGGVSLEEPRSLSTFAMGNHIIVGPTMRSLNPLGGEQTLRPLNFNQLNQQDNAQKLDTDLTLIHDEVAIGNSLNHSLIETRDYKGIRQDSTACGSNDIDETSSMPSWVRNEYIQQQEDGVLLSGGSPMFRIESSTTTTNSSTSSHVSLDTNKTLDGLEEFGTLEGSSTDYAENDNLIDQQPSHLEANNIDRNPGLSGSFSSANSIKHVLRDENKLNELETTSRTLYQCINQQQARSQNNESNYAQQPNSPLSQNKSLSISKSQPDISKQECRISKLDSSMTRRASILNDSKETVAQSNNLLDCNVYRASSQDERNYESSNFHSILSSLANSHNQLIKPDHICSHLQEQPELSTRPTTLPDQTTTSGGAEASYSWSKLNMSDTSFQLKSIDENSNNHQRDRYVNHHHHYGKHMALSQSDAQIHPPHSKDVTVSSSGTASRMGSKYKASSSSSLASLRRSLMKLFC